MRFIPVTPGDREKMLAAVGASSVDELFADIPEGVRLRRPLDLPEGMSEMEVSAHVGALAADNTPAGGLVSFAGAGCYDHHIPSIVGHVTLKPEFFTAYTPYQPEVSQGTLQAIYEFQSLICELTGMDVANASMYDGATATVEAAFLAAHFTKRTRVVVSRNVHPEWRETMRTYGLAGGFELVEAPLTGGVTDVAALRDLVEDAAAVIVADPGFLGTLDDLAAIGQVAHDAGAVFVVAANPMLLGVLAAPADSGADVVVGEGQPLGNPMSFGGPGLGFFTCRDEYLRRMPGRIVGRTVDVDGRDGFVLTMQTREQHIRREKATSNICSNQALAALAAAVHLSCLGPDGLADVGRACVAKAHHLRDALLETGRFSAPWEAPFAHEFALRYGGDVAAMQAAMLERGILAGVDLARFDGEDSGLVLFAVTERRTRAEIDRFVKEVASL
jgi:glycine dehydrogenase subunit 1